MPETKQGTPSPHQAQLRFVGLLLVIGLSRHLPLSQPEWSNFSPVLAIILLSGASLRGGLSWLTPLCAVLVTDLFINPSYGASLLEPFMLVTLFSYLLVYLLGKRFRKSKSLVSLVGGGILGALLFHILTCGFAWLANPAYAKSVGGFVQALTLGEPGFPPAYLFLRNSLASAILFTAAIGWFALRLGEPSPSPAKASPARTS